MYGKYQLNVIVVFTVVIYRYEGRLPVICVNDVRHKVYEVEAVHYSLTEEGVSLAVIVEAIKSVTMEVVFIVNKVVGHVILLQLKEPAVEISPGKPYIVVAEVLCRIPILLADITVIRHHHSYVIVTSCSKCLWKASKNFSEAACGSKWKNL